MASGSSLRDYGSVWRKPPKATPATTEKAQQEAYEYETLMIRLPMLSRRLGTYWLQEMEAWYRICESNAARRHRHWPAEGLSPPAVLCAWRWLGREMTSKLAHLL